ncbi:MAG: alpha-L-fucosidase [Clostridia bacterium]|nr:alpha-L-fucosidase [Clostridia bacterium]
MIVKEYIKRFETLGFGMFVHFGLYSENGKGEWALRSTNISPSDYEKLFDVFNPVPEWADELAATARAAGCKYITLTTRHHDGFSLYDTCGLNAYDAPHSAAGRDLVREFVDACHNHGIIPFFYHTLLDWHEPTYYTDFPAYLKYLRRSVEILCTRYGKIGGLWFDGMWDRPNDDWEEDALYGMIRTYQPEAMIINNTGLHARGALGHIELDSVTFERGRPGEINLEDSPKYIASEMCQIFADHWGYAKRDFHFKSLAEIIGDYCICRRFGANFLLNVGPMGNGLLRPLDKAMLLTLGEWAEIHRDALYLPRPTKIAIEGKDKDFLLRGEGCYYLFVHDIPMGGNINVAERFERADYTDRFALPEKIRSIKWLDSGKDLDFVQNGERVTVCYDSQKYGENLVIKIAKIEI